MYPVSLDCLVPYCQFLWIVLYPIASFSGLSCILLPVSLDCLFLIAPSVFSSVYCIQIMSQYQRYLYWLQFCRLTDFVPQVCYLININHIIDDNIPKSDPSSSSGWFIFSYFIWVSSFKVSSKFSCDFRFKVSTTWKASSRVKSLLYPNVSLTTSFNSSSSLGLKIKIYFN